MNRVKSIVFRNKIENSSKLVLIISIFFNPKILSPSQLSIGIGKYLSDLKENYHTLNVCYSNDIELNLFERIKLITEFTKSPNRLLL